jgi:quercetin dioxygenase-like cupin family protein
MRVPFAFYALASMLACATAAAQTAPAPAAANPLEASRVFRYEEMTTRVAPNGAEGRNVFRGTLATGESVGAHESMLPAGAPPVPLHPIRHSEMIVVQQGTVAFDHDGKSEIATPGSIVYVAIGTVHRIRNVGDGPARYVVLQVGGDIKK